MEYTQHLFTWNNYFLRIFFFLATEPRFNFLAYLDKTVMNLSILLTSDVDPDVVQKTSMVLLILCNICKDKISQAQV